MQTNNTRQHKALENRVRREARRKGYLLRRSRLHDDSNGLYLLVGDSRGNRLPGAAAAPNAFRRGEGDTLECIAEELGHLPG
jgi:hypothetical protein